MPSIPANLFVNVQPGVLNAGGNSLALNGLAITNSGRVPIGTVLSFSSGQAVTAYFGAGSAEDKAANGGTNLGSGYFGGFLGSNRTPGAMLFAPYNATAVGAYLRGGSVANLTLTQLQAISGTLSIVFDGAIYTNASINLSAAASFSAAATSIQTALNTATPTEAVGTASIATTVMTVTAMTSGQYIPGQVLTGSGVTANTKIVNQLTGTPGQVGTYTVDTSQTTASTAITGKSTLTVTYDSVSGAFLLQVGTTGPLSTSAFATGTTAAALALTAATGAVLSQGAAAATPATAMASVIANSQNWATFFTTFDPDGGSGNTLKQAFAAWTNSQNNRYAYIAWDTDITPTQTVPATNSLGYLLQQNNSSGTCVVYEPSDLNLAAFISGAVASIDFQQHDGRTTLAFRQQTGLLPSVTSQQVAVNLGGNPQAQGDFGNGYNYYGAVATANQAFQFLQRGTVSGPFKWLDSYINQIWLNNAFQLALMNLLVNQKSIPYNTAGYGLIEAALADPINAGLNFGAFRPGVPLSVLQAAEVNTAAGIQIDQVLTARGWYLQILPAAAIIRQNRGTPQMTFWYMDGESIQSFNLASIVIQ